MKASSIGLLGYLKEDLPKDGALRAAQLDMSRPAQQPPGRESQTRGVKVLSSSADRETCASPFYWAAFQIIGDWR